MKIKKFYSEIQTIPHLAGMWAIVLDTTHSTYWVWTVQITWTWRRKGRWLRFGWLTRPR